MIQGDIISPIFFILTMEQLFRVHDPSPTDVKVGNYLQVGVLGYVDDAAFISLDTTTMSTRLTNISIGSHQDADMIIHKGKTKAMHVERQTKMPPPTEKEIKVTEVKYKHECKFCGRRHKAL